ncbi:hypothetical protein HPC49_44060, partial [Pyxidicoccus fallax]
MSESKRLWSRVLAVLTFVALLEPDTAQAAPRCERTVTASVVALDQPLFLNRLGARVPGGMVFALQRDVVPTEGTELLPGKVALRPGKRPRPLVLRANVGDCLRVEFTNLLSPAKPQAATQTYTLNAGVTAIGLPPVTVDGSFVGANTSTLIPPGAPKLQPDGRRYSAVYTFYAEAEGTFLLHSTGANFDFGLPGNKSSFLTGGQLSAGLFGAVNVEPRGSEWYRSQVSAEELKLATRRATPTGQPVLDYGAVFPKGYQRPQEGGVVPEGTPVLRMLDARNEIVHSDLTAVITGPGAGRLAVKYPLNPALPDREQPFREFTLIYHEMFNATQAFDAFDASKQQTPDAQDLANTLSIGGDNFGINYGTGGIGAEIWANRIGVGPAANCPECKFEEFFLSSWANGDPAMVVDVPANQKGQKATRAVFSDDPTNVYHSYLSDHVRFRVIHGGSSIHHIHHLHAQQWLHAPDSDQSQYLDSQAIGPGVGYTLDMVYNGTGNKNRTVGDSIFHCHFYPHFAAGMWSLWRAHDVFEPGTELDKAGYPVATARALPDGEIQRGTPIPAVVPLPTLAMAPMPAPVRLEQGQVVVDATRGNPGFPFYVPGAAGHRPPHPPMDFAVLNGKPQNGGLPRHLVTGGTAKSVQTRLDFSKDSTTLKAVELPEEGTAAEKVAMAFHATNHASFKPDGSPAQFLTNALPPKPGAPYADPCAGTTNERRYRAANIEMDVTLNKKGWHFPQQRMLALWEDVQPTFNGTRQPEPLFFRANSGECIEYWHTNLVPDYYQLDDFQVRTPVDILGQHIHLVKFDVTASDGAANGWNYEDGTFSPDEVRARIKAINATGGLDSGGRKRLLTPVPAPAVFGPQAGKKFLGAQTTIQRWAADPLLDNQGKDRTLRTVFTHDHFGPSTHQQAGLYAGLLVEPAGSKWRDPVTGLLMGTRDDGGPTSFQADILTPNVADSYREFALEFQDMQLAYKPDVFGKKQAAGKMGLANPALAVSPPACATRPDGTSPTAPCPSLISQVNAGTFSVNYRSEPLPFRVGKVSPATASANIESVPSGTPDPSDLSNVFLSLQRADPALNRQPNPVVPGMGDTDPYTPLLRAYQGDPVQVRVMAGGQDSIHNFNMHGVRWLFEPSDRNSGYRASQPLGISEHYEMLFTLPRTGGDADYLYNPSATVAGLDNGNWGILRAYAKRQAHLLVLPSNPAPTEGPATSVCPPGAPRPPVLKVSAYTAAQVLPAQPEKGVVYYSRNGVTLSDTQALLYVRDDDIDPATGKLRDSAPVEPLVLRARAGDCITVQLTNKLDTRASVFTAKSQAPAAFGDITLQTSTHVGLHPQLLSFDVRAANGVNVGRNGVSSVAPGESRTYEWYAGEVRREGNNVVGRPIEFGAVNLYPSDPLQQHAYGLVGALIVEPAGSTWVEDELTHASATVRPSSGAAFREFVLVSQESLNLGLQTPPTGGFQAVNYRTEPMAYRYGLQESAAYPAVDLSCATSDRLQQGSTASASGAPNTPVFTAAAGQPVRFRLLHAGDHFIDGSVFTIEGHSWQESPFTKDSTEMGSNPRSPWMSARVGFGATDHFNIVLASAGGPFAVSRDYLYRSFISTGMLNGSWGIFRVSPQGRDSVTFTRAQDGSVRGANTVSPVTGRYARTVKLFSGVARKDGSGCVGTALASIRVGKGGQWAVPGKFPTELCAQSDSGGVGEWTAQV